MDRDAPTASPPTASRANMRPRSSASSTSAASATTQPSNLRPDQSQMPSRYPMDWQQHGHVHPHMQQGPDPSSAQGDNLLFLQHVSNMNANPDHFQVNSFNQLANQQLQAQAQAQQKMQQHQYHMQAQQQMAAQHQHQMQAHGQQMQQLAWNGVPMPDQFPPAIDTSKVPTSKGGKKRSNANNDGEMKELFQGSRGKPLDEVANNLRANERGPNAERTRQLYAMLWLDKACVVSKNSIPRSRVYHVYASRCTEDRVMILNPASFGKLVRVVFPEIKTRRLGVRGESKYHYCNFDLRDPPPVTAEDTPKLGAPVPDTEEQGAAFDFNTPPTQPAEETSAARLPSPEEGSHNQPTQPLPSRLQGSPSFSLYNISQLPKDAATQTQFSKTPRRLVIATEEDKICDWNEKVVLPDIHPYLPPNTDPDTAESLVVLYRSQCTSLIESFRYMKDKNLFHLYTSFHGTMTMPVQKVFAHESIAPWIEACDIYLYQRLVRFVFGMSLQAFPRNIFNKFQSISQRLPDHIRKTFQGLPDHLVRAKLGPAIIFSGILERMTRVNLAAHAAASTLALEANRDLMYEEWLEHINPRKIVECVPTCGMDATVEILVNEMRRLVNPVHVKSNSLDLDMDLFNEGAEETSGSPVDRWRTFLMSLPSKFPNVPHADIVSCVDRVGTAILREFTIQGCNSFSTWWATKAFVDEEVFFLAAVGGFLRTSKIQELAEPAKPRAATGVPQDGAPTAAVEKDVDMGNSEETTAQAASPGRSDRAPFPPKNSGAIETNVDAHEDSGIGIRTPEADFPMDKFTFSEEDAHDVAYA